MTMRRRISCMAHALVVLLIILAILPFFAIGAGGQSSSGAAWDKPMLLTAYPARISQMHDYRFPASFSLFGEAVLPPQMQNLVLSGLRLLRHVVFSANAAVRQSMSRQMRSFVYSQFTLLSINRISASVISFPLGGHAPPYRFCGF